MPLRPACLLLLVAVSVATPASAQGRYERAAIGAGVGIAGGAVVTLSLIVARARFQGEFIESADDLIHWQSAPMLLAPAAGITFGFAGRDPLEASILGSTAGMVAGAAVGATFGWLASDATESPWAGAIMGAGAGMTLGGLLLGIRAWTRSTPGDEGPPISIGVRLAL